MNFGYLKYTHTLGIVASGRGDLLTDKNSCATSVNKGKRVLNLFSDLNVNFFFIFSAADNFRSIMSLSFHTSCHTTSRFLIFYWACKALL